MRKQSDPFLLIMAFSAPELVTCGTYAHLAEVREGPLWSADTPFLLRQLIRERNQKAPIAFALKWRQRKDARQIVLLCNWRKTGQSSQWGGHNLYKELISKCNNKNTTKEEPFRVVRNTTFRTTLLHSIRVFSRRGATHVCLYHTTHALPAQFFSLEKQPAT